jgi:hypothetical protein
MICGLLRSADIACDHRAAQAGEMLGAGAYEVLVRDEDLEAARAMLPSEQ